MVWKLKKSDAETQEVPKEIKEVVAQSPISPTKQKEEILVVRELPVQQVRQSKKEDGTIINFITVEEALTELLNAGAQ
jgi:hypothetical protein